VALQQFAPAMGGCVKVGDKIRLTKPVVRRVAAEALYRLSASMSQLAAASSVRTN
jgi:hypothetical protein